MTDQEFARSRKIDKAPRGFALRKDGTQESYWEMIKNDVSFAIALHFTSLIFYRMKSVMYVPSHPFATDPHEIMHRYFTEP
jgi:hypothetical protein